MYSKQYLVVDDEPADEGRDDGDDVRQEVGDAHQTRAEVGSQVDVHQLGDTNQLYGQLYSV